jgi:hypothetical protein
MPVGRNGEDADGERADRPANGVGGPPAGRGAPPGAWWIASVVLPYGSEEETPTVRALVRRGRVSALALYVGAAGD